jgi:hypothetical protein
MTTQHSDIDRVRSLFQENKILTLARLKEVLGTTSTMTVYRRLKTLSYLTSYSHRGKFYTLPDIPEFDDMGLWSDQGVYFSCSGNLVRTIRHLIDASQMGYGATDLESLLHVEVKHALLELVRAKQIGREKISGLFIYLSGNAGVRQAQVLLQRQWRKLAELRAIGSDLPVDEVKAALILFFSLLDEKQRRLYAGLEAARLGHGGDRRIAELLALDAHTVARGRRELLGGEVDRTRLRGRGGGRKSVKKKRPKSSSASKS